MRAGVLIAVTALFLGACGGGGGGGATASPPPPAPPPPPPPPPPAVVSYNVDLSATEVPGGSSESGSATAVVMHNTTDGLLDITVTLSGVSADGASLGRAYAGAVGDELFALDRGKQRE